MNNTLTSNLAGQARGRRRRYDLVAVLLLVPSAVWSAEQPSDSTARHISPTQARCLFPVHPNVVNVTQPPYNAKGDGAADDTAALQLAINENTGQHRMLYVPPGTYLVSATLTWPKKWAGRDNWGKTILRGHSRD